MNTNKLSTSQVAPGMTVAEDVYTFNNQLIIQKDTVLTDKIITRLKFYSIQKVTVYAQAETAAAPKPAPVIPETYSNQVRKSPEFKKFKSTLTATTAFVKDQLTNIVKFDADIREDLLLTELQHVLDNGRNGIHIFDMLHSLRSENDETFTHSVNVSLISNVLAKWLKFSRKDIDTVTLCGLLHDIGKLAVPNNILTKPSRLTEDEYEIMKSHTVRGYNILRTKDINIHIKMATMMHHERCDGSGYPLGLMEDQIDKFAKIVMIADVYDAMTCARVYRGPLCPFEVMMFFEHEGLQKYDPHYILTFLEHVNQSYLNNTVRLSNQMVGTIVMSNPTIPSRPVIRVGDQFIDLSKENDLYIEAVL